jgi:hypothetical protein
MFPLALARHFVCALASHSLLVELFRCEFGVQLLVELNWCNLPQCSEGVSLQPAVDTSTKSDAVANQPTSRNRDTLNMAVANSVREFPYFLDP